MKFKNLHCHKIRLYIYSNYQFQPKEQIDEFSISKEIYIQKIAYALYCNDCNLLNKDYNSNFVYGYGKMPIFGDKEAIADFKKFNPNIKFFEYLTIGNFIIIGTKDEIIQYVIKKYQNLEKRKEWFRGRKKANYVRFNERKIKK